MSGERARHSVPAFCGRERCATQQPGECYFLTCMLMWLFMAGRRTAETDAAPILQCAGLQSLSAPKNDLVLFLLVSFSQAANETID